MSTTAERQAAFKLRSKQRGLTYINVQIPETLRDRLKEIARVNNTTMKELITVKLEETVNEN